MNLLLLKWGGIAFAIFVALAITYRTGGSSPRAELRAYRAQMEAQLQQAKQDKERADRDYQMDVTNREFAWSEWLRLHPLRATSTVATVCADDAGNQRLSGAINQYREELGRIRQEVRECYIDADKLQAQLINVNQWALDSSGNQQ